MIDNGKGYKTQLRYPLESIVKSSVASGPKLRYGVIAKFDQYSKDEEPAQGGKGYVSYEGTEFMRRHALVSSLIMLVTVRSNLG